MYHIQYLFMIKKNSTNLEYKGINLIMDFYEKITASITLNSKKLDAFPLRFRTRQECSLLLPLINIILEVIANTIRKK